MKYKIGLWLRLVVSLGSMVVLFLSVDLVKLTDLFGQIEMYRLIGPWIMFGAVIGINAFRWKVLLAAPKVRYFTLLRFYFSGLFVNQFIPGTIGGDAFRAYKTGSLINNPSRALATVVVDRLIGAIALTCLCGFYWLLFGSLTDPSVSKGAITALVILASVEAVFVVLAKTGLTCVWDS